MKTFFSGNTTIRVGHDWFHNLDIERFLRRSRRGQGLRLRFVVTTEEGRRDEGHVSDTGGAWMQRAADILGYLVLRRRWNPMDLDLRGDLIYLSERKGAPAREHPYR